MGLSLPVEESIRLPQLNAVAVPDGIDEAAVRSHLLNDFSLEIGAGLGALAGKVWRVGLMGFSSKPANVRLCLSALETALLAQGLKLPAGDAIQAANAVYSD
jgi:alanine-glyoxylate transaminase/serine-glyoxylate transaminase/serine-pyruvate transaminase